MGNRGITLVVVCLFTPGIVLAQHAWTVEFESPGASGVVGVTEDSMVTGPPWDTDGIDDCPPLGDDDVRCEWLSEHTFGDPAHAKNGVLAATLDGSISNQNVIFLSDVWSDTVNSGSIWWVDYDVHFIGVNPADLQNLRLTTRYQHGGVTFLTLNLLGLPGSVRVLHRVAPTHFWTDTPETGNQWRVQLTATRTVAGAPAMIWVDNIHVTEGATVHFDETFPVMDGEGPFIVHALGLPGETRPHSGYIDPLIESSDGVHLDRGTTEMTIVFNEQVRSLGGGPLSEADFSLRETGITSGIDESQVPPAGTGSSAFGFGNVALNDAETQLTIHVEHSLDTVTAGHIHRAAAGQNGSVVFGFPDPSSPIDEVWFLSPSDVDDLEAGLLYVNLHSAAFPGGEIRGQIVPNSILSIDSTGNPVVVVSLSRPLSLSEWTTVQAAVEDLDGNPISNLGDLGADMDEPDRVDLGFLPNDASQDGDVFPIDLLRFRQILLGTFMHPQGLDEDYADYDRSGAMLPLDLLRFRQGFSGTGFATRVWFEESMNDARP